MFAKLKQELCFGYC